MKTMKAVAVAMVFWVLGCVGGEPEALTYDPAKVVQAPEHADEVLAELVTFYGLDPVPTVYWYGGADLDCAGGAGFVDSEGDCVHGVTHHDEFTIVSNYWALKDGLVGDTALAHEMGHAASWQRGEGGDRGHKGHFFLPGGEVEQAYDMLYSKGL